MQQRNSRLAVLGAAVILVTAAFGCEPKRSSRFGGNMSKEQAINMVKGMKMTPEEREKAIKSIEASYAKKGQ